MAVVRLVEELSRSSTGRHVERKLAFIVKDERVLKPAGIGEPVKPVYSRGSAKAFSINLREGEYGVQVRLVRNPRGRVKGYLEVYGADGEVIYKAVIVRKKMRYSKGDRSYSWVASITARKIGLDKYLRKITL